MMINNLKQLNDFVEKSGVKSENHIIPKLIESGEIVSAEIARVITSRDSRGIRIFAPQTFSRR